VIRSAWTVSDKLALRMTACDGLAATHTDAGADLLGAIGRPFQLAMPLRLTAAND